MNIGRTIRVFRAEPVASPVPEPEPETPVIGAGPVVPIEVGADIQVDADNPSAVRLGG